MPKYLFEVSYRTEGVKGLVKEGASGRRSAVEQLMKSAGGKLEAMYYAFGQTDVYLIADLPDNAAAAAVSLSTATSGMVRTNVVPLLSVEEIDAAGKKSIKYRPPGGK